MLMTMEQYAKNPGLGSTIPAHIREAQWADYRRIYTAMMLREQSKMPYLAYYDKGKNAYYLHFKVPSQRVANFYYDVVFKFFVAEGTTVADGKDLFKWNVQFFSNDPAFMYNWAYSFTQNDLFVKECASKMSKLALKQPAEVTNPGNTIGWEKAICMAYLYMKDHGLNLTGHHTSAIPYNKANMLADIETADDKLADRQAEQKKASKLRKFKRRSTTQVRKAVTQNLIKQAKTTKRIEKISAAKGAVKTKVVKTVKRK